MSVDTLIIRLRTICLAAIARFVVLVVAGMRGGRDLAPHQIYAR
jgi:hypothetical protein